nr:hypothetical protein [Tanacetum cinerariifolium]
MAFSVISISSDSSEKIVGTSFARVVLFGTIPATIPPTTPTTDLPVIHDDTSLTPTISPTIPTIPHDPYEVVVTRWRSRVAARSSPPSSHIRKILPAPLGLPARPAALVLSGQPIHVGRPYLTQPNGVLKMLTARKSRCRSPTSFVPMASPVCGALSPICADLSPPPKRIRGSDSMTDFEVSSEDEYEPYVPKETGLGVDVKDSYEPYIEPNIDPDVQENIDECFAYSDVIRARRTDVRVVVETAIEEEVESSARGTVEVDPRVVPVIKDNGHRITGVDLEVTTMTERISALERDITRLRGMLDVQSQRVDRLQRGTSLGLGFLLVLSAFAMLAACAFRAATRQSSISCRMAA